MQQKHAWEGAQEGHKPKESALPGLTFHCMSAAANKGCEFTSCQYASTPTFEPPCDKTTSPRSELARGNELEGRLFGGGAYQGAVESLLGYPQFSGELRSLAQISMPIRMRLGMGDLYVLIEEHDLSLLLRQLHKMLTFYVNPLSRLECRSAEGTRKVANQKSGIIQ
jgi:hypothetical protein